MTKKTLAITMLTILALTSCKQTTKQDIQKEAISKKDTGTNLLIGSWVEPIPINKNEVQGIKFNTNGTAESINMATLVYKKWWKEADKLVLVSESIGNGSSAIDTLKYEIAILNEKELELRDREYTLKYKRQ